METTRANVFLDSWILQHAKRVAKEQGKTLGEFTSEALKWHVARHDFGKVPPLTAGERTEGIRRQEAEEIQRRTDDEHRRTEGKRGAA